MNRGKSFNNINRQDILHQRSSRESNPDKAPVLEKISSPKNPGIDATQFEQCGPPKCGHKMHPGCDGPHKKGNRGPKC